MTSKKKMGKNMLRKVRSGKLVSQQQNGSQENLRDLMNRQSLNKVPDVNLDMVSGGKTRY